MTCEEIIRGKKKERGRETFQAECILMWSKVCYLSVKKEKTLSHKACIVQKTETL